jgi:hypothetical protein
MNNRLPNITKNLKMNNQNDDPNNQQNLQKIQKSNAYLSHTEDPRKNKNQQIPIISDQETNEVNFRELNSSPSSQLSSANKSR